MSITRRQVFGRLAATAGALLGVRAVVAAAPKAKMFVAEYDAIPVPAGFTPVQVLHGRKGFTKRLCAALPGGHGWVQVPCCWSQLDIERSTPKQFAALMLAIDRNAIESLEDMVLRDRGLRIRCVL